MQNDNNDRFGSATRKDSILMPIFAIFIFTMLVFSAGYAYFTVGGNSMNIATHNITLPSRTTLTCNSTQLCTMVPTYASMAQSANSTTAKNSCTLYMNCVCAGSSGGKCNYNINLASIGTTYTPSSGASNSVKEFTVQVTALGTNCAVDNTSTTEQMVNGLVSKNIVKCTLVPGDKPNTTVVFKWYNANINQDTQAGKTYKYRLSAFNPVLT